MAGVASPRTVAMSESVGDAVTSSTAGPASSTSSAVGPAVHQDVRDRVDPSRTRVHLVCIPQAGMGAWAFNGWQRSMPSGVEVLPVELPGRNSRLLVRGKREKLSRPSFSTLESLLISLSAFSRLPVSLDP